MFTWVNCENGVDKAKSGIPRNRRLSKHKDRVAIGELYIFALLFTLIIINPIFSLKSVTTGLCRFTKGQKTNS